MDLQLICDLLVYSNDTISEEKDYDGKETLEVLKNTKKILEIINSKNRGR